MKYAIIDEGIVTNIVLADDQLAENWIASDAAQIGWTYEGDIFAPPPAPPPAPTYATAAEAKAAMTAWINQLTGTVQNTYPQVVQNAWFEEEAMAAAYLSGTEDAAQLATLTADGLAKGRTPAEHAARILDNAQTFRSIAAQMRRLWLATDAALDEVVDPHEYEAVLTAAIAQAAPLAAAYGLG